MSTRARILLSALLCLGLLPTCGNDAKPTGQGGTNTGGDGAGGTNTGGGGEGGGTNTGGSDNPAPPGFSIIFPPPDSVTDEATLTVRGTANPADVKGVAVAGVPAQSSDGFATWQAELPLSLGPQTIHVDLVDGSGTSLPGVAVLSVQRADVLLREPQRLGLDVAGSRAFVWDLGLVEISLTTGARTIIANLSVGTGPLPNDVRGAAWDAAKNRLWLLDGDKLVSVDPASGARTLVADSATGAGAFPDANDMALDTASGRLIVVDGSAVTAIDPNSGDRTVISDAVTGVGPSISQPRAIAVDSAGARAFVGTDSKGVFAVDLVTGDRSVVSSSNKGSGAPVPYFISLVYDANSKRLIAGTLSGLIRIDTASGDREILADINTGSGPPPMRAEGIAFDGSKVLAVDRYLDAVVSVDATTGDRSVVSGYFAASGFRPLLTRKGAWDASHGRLLTAQVSIEPAVLSIAADGARVVVASATLGSGPLFVAPWDVAVAGSSAFLANVFDVSKLNPTTGERVTISGASVGSGPALMNASLLISRPDGQQLWVRQSPATILSVDVATGNRTLVADDANGSGPAFGYISDLVFDTTRLLVITSTSVLDLDPATGNRTTISDSQKGTGPALFNASDAVLAGKDTLVVLQLGSILSVNLMTGERAELPKPGKGELFRTVFDGLSRSEAGVLYTYGLFLNAMVAVDSLTGERVIYSK